MKPIGSAILNGLLCSWAGSALASGTNLSPPGSVEEHSPKIDKRGCTLWNPTPRKHLREMNALYDSPYTVDAGHVQVETYALFYSHNDTGSDASGVRTESWYFAYSTLKLGLLNNLDVELELAPYTRVRTADRISGTVTRQHGFGDLIPKAKLNLWGNDGGSTALALMPFVKIPTSQDGLGNDAVEGGLVVPVAIELPRGWWIGLSPEFDWIQDGDERGYHFEFADTAYFWHPIVGDLSGYVEFVSWVSTERNSRWIGTVDFGLTYMLTKDIQLDAAVLIGVTPSADDLSAFLGISFRY